MEESCDVESLCWQESVGVEGVTDGEFRRESWRLGSVAKVEGFARADAIGDVDLQRDDAGNVARIGSAPVAVAKVRRAGPIGPDEVSFSLSKTASMGKTTPPPPSYPPYPPGKACGDPPGFPGVRQVFY